MINIAILGAAGRMGQIIIRCVKQFQKLHLVGAVESDNCSSLGRDAGFVAGIGDIGVILSTNIAEAAHQADVLIDFSFPSATAEHVMLIADTGKAMVIGTTGLDRQEAGCVKKASTVIPIVWAPNMSMGVNLLFSLVAKTAAILGNYDIEIIETHHRHKKDAPSGTALRLAESAASARDLKSEAIITHGRHGQVGEKPDGQIGIHAVRTGDVIGDHTVIFAADGERIELTHRASSRECFAIGSLKAAEWVSKRKPGLYTMQDVLDQEAIKPLSH